MRRYIYLGVSILSVILLSACNKIDEDSTITGKVGYAVAYIDTAAHETTYVFYPARYAKLYLTGDKDAQYPYSGPVLTATADSLGNYTFVVDAVTSYEGSLAPASNIGIKIQAFYFDSLLGPGYGELTYYVTPGRDDTLPTIYLKRQTQ